MYLLEVAAQNVKGFSPRARVPLRPGLLLLQPPSEGSGLATLLAALLYPDGRGSDAALASGPQAKASVTLLGKDQLTYRVSKELGQGGMVQRLNSAEKRFETLSQNAAEITSCMRSAGLPTMGTWDSIFVFSDAQLPSRKPLRSTSPRLTPSPESKPQIKVADVEKRLKELNDELALTQTVANLQSQVDILAQEIFELERSTQAVQDLRAALAEARAAHEKAPSAESLGLPADVVQRCRRYPDQLAKKEADLARLAEGGGEEAVAPLPQTPFYRSPAFWGGVASGVCLFVVGLLVKGALKYLALLDIPAFGFAAVLAYRHVEELQKLETESRRSDRKSVRGEKILKEFDAQMAPVRKAMEALQVSAVEEVVRELQRKEELGQKAVKLEQQLIALATSKQVAAAEQKLDVARKKQELFQQKLAGYGTGYVRDAKEIEREMEKLKRSSSHEKIQVAQPTPPQEKSRYADPSPALLKCAAELLQQDVAGAGASIKDRVLQYFAAFTDKRYSGVQIAADGRALVTSATGLLSVAELPPADLDLFFLSLKLTTVEKAAAARNKVPVVVEGGWSAVEESKRPLLGKMLKHLGTLTQVLVVGDEPSFVVVADGSGTL